MGDAGVVDEQGQRLAFANPRDRLDAGVGAEIGDQGLDTDVREGDDEFIETLAAAADDDQIIAFGAESQGEGATYAGGGAGDERQRPATGRTRRRPPTTEVLGGPPSRDQPLSDHGEAGAFSPWPWGPDSRRHRAATATNPARLVRPNIHSIGA